MKANLAPIVVVFLISILVSLQLFNSGLHTMHDDQQVARLFLYDQALRAGQFPVRWVDGLGFGFGYPLFVFYPPFVYMVGQLIHFLGFSLIDSVKAVFVLSIFLSGLTMYWLVKEIWGKFSGVTAAMFYVLAPYRALDIYVRGALAESFSFVWLPLILWSFLKLAQANNWFYVLTAACSLSLLMITHNLIFLPFVMILSLFLVVLALGSKNKALFLLQLLASAVLATGLSAFFWAPALLEKKYTIVDDLLLVNLANYNLHFVYLQQLWNWTWGFGGSTSGIMDGISFKIGKLHIITAVFCVLLASLIRLKVKNKLVSYNWLLTITIFSLFTLSAFMTLGYSKFIWETIAPLAYLQFPWRFLTFTTLFSSILAGGLIYFLRLTILRTVVFFLLTIAVIIPNLKLFQPQFYRENLSDEQATSQETINWDVSLSSFEYLPKGIQLKKNELGANSVDVTKSDIPTKKVQILSGDASISEMSQSPAKLEFAVDASKHSEIMLNVVDFPRWTVTVNGQEKETRSDNKFKLITFDVDPGLSKIEASFENTRIRSYSNLITLLALLSLAAAVTYLKFSKRVNLK